MSHDIHTITSGSELYPPLLREGVVPPEEFYVRGEIALLHHPRLLAVVGSRRATSYGKQALAKVLPAVLRADIVVVSGLAFGIDSLAHRLSVEAERPTIAVLGSGIDDASIYPRAHITLAHQILAGGGAILSEYPPGTPGYQSHFPERNRIIAGLTQATVIVQAAIRSGSLITARLALECGREVCAVPGAITDPLSEGTNRLIRDGATPILEAADILQLYGISEPNPASAPPAELSLQQSAVLAALSSTPQHIDVITASARISPEITATLLVELELLEQVQHVGGMQYVRRM